MAGRRLSAQRPDIAASTSLGIALSAGLVWYEQDNGTSIGNPVLDAVGFAVIVMTGVIYQSIRRVEGNWAGAEIAVANGQAVNPEVADQLVSAAGDVFHCASWLPAVGEARFRMAKAKKPTDKKATEKKVRAVITPLRPIPPRPAPPEESEGLRCPKCHSAFSDVIWTRPVANIRIRCRQCVHCGTRLRTSERVDSQRQAAPTRF